jgi:hemin uptake protein HemP
MKTLTLPSSPELQVHRHRQPAVEAPSASVEVTLASDLLMKGRKVIQIEHNGALYQLRATKLGKLILTK